MKIAQADNCKADALSRLIFMGVDRLDRTVHIKILMEPRISQTLDIIDIDQEPLWIDPILDFITNGNSPEDSQTARVFNLEH